MRQGVVADQLYTARRPDGWPLCPACGQDELYSVANPPTEATIAGCCLCDWRLPEAMRRRPGVPSGPGASEGLRDRRDAIVLVPLDPARGGGSR